MAVTVIVVYQHSMPWLRVTLEALRRYNNAVAAHVMLIENVPNDSRACMAAARSFLDVYDKGFCSLLQSNVNGVSDPGARHARGLSVGFHAVRTPWTLFLDADCVPLRDGWLDHMLAQEADIVGPPAFHNLKDYSMVHAHPSLLLFRTKLGRQPYWNENFLQIRRHPKTGKKIFWDVGIGFTHLVGSRPDVTLKRLPQQECNDYGCQYYRIADIAIHMRGTSNVTTRKSYPQDHKQGLLHLPEFSFYQEEVNS